MAKHKIRRVAKKLDHIFPIGKEIGEDGRTPEGALFPSQLYVEDLRDWCGEHET